MTLPNFLVIGASRSGTTSLHHYLGQHPQVFMCPVKEPNYFGFPGQDPGFRGRGTRSFRRHSVLDHDAYRRLFDGVDGEPAIGEVSPLYLHADHAAAHIRQQIPDARLIAILRHPVERAYATYIGRCRDGFETAPSILDAIRDEPRRLREKRTVGGLIHKGYYHRHLQRYFDRFDRDQLRVYLFEDLLDDPRALLRDIFRFLGVDPDFEPDLSTQHNPSGSIRNPLLRALWKRCWYVRAVTPYVLPRTLRDHLYRLVTHDVVKPSLPAGVYNDLVEMFRDDILKLQDLLGRDLSHWLAHRPSDTLASGPGR